MLAVSCVFGCSTTLELFPERGENVATGGSSLGGNNSVQSPHDDGQVSFGGGGGAFPAEKGEPTLLILNTDAPCPDDISFTDDLLEMVFDSRQEVLLTSRRDSRLSAWSPAVPVEGVGVPGADSGAEISYDGLSLWWMSSRSEVAPQSSLWFATRPTRSAPWGPATEVVELNEASNEAFPTLTADQLLVVFVKDQDLRFSTRASTDSMWAPSAVLANVNTIWADTNPKLSADGLSLYFASNRSGGPGGTDLYVAHRASRSDDFGAPEALHALNTPVDEADPWLSSDGSLLVFLRKGGSNDCSFYSVEL